MSSSSSTFSSLAPSLLARATARACRSRPWVQSNSTTVAPSKFKPKSSTSPSVVGSGKSTNVSRTSQVKPTSSSNPSDIKASSIARAVSRESRSCPWQQPRPSVIPAVQAKTDTARWVKSQQASDLRHLPMPTSKWRDTSSVSTSDSTIISHLRVSFVDEHGPQQACRPERSPKLDKSTAAMASRVLDKYDSEATNSVINNLEEKMRAARHALTLSRLDHVADQVATPRRPTVSSSSTLIPAAPRATRFQSRSFTNAIAFRKPKALPALRGILPKAGDKPSSLVKKVTFGAEHVLEVSKWIGTRAARAEHVEVDPTRLFGGALRGWQRSSADDPYSFTTIWGQGDMFDHSNCTNPVCNRREADIHRHWPSYSTNYWDIKRDLDEFDEWVAKQTPEEQMRLKEAQQCRIRYRH